MANVRAQVQLATTSGVLEDRPTNVFHFVMTADGATADLVTTALSTFYTSLGTKFPTTIASSGHTVKFYDLAAPTPRAPFAERSLTVGGARATTSLPAEVALCLSFQGTRQSGSSQARRRGRIYIGPLGQNQAAGDGRPGSGMVADLVAAGAALLAASNAAVSWNWEIWSPTSGQMVPVANGWVDNAFDTQRRRGVSPSSRSTFP